MPYGNHDFKDIRLNNYVYIDKTKYIETIEKTGRKFIHVLRPRRFGKTLFTSMLSAYYDINAKDEFDVLFHGTYIYDHQTEERNQYYILRFDFSGLNTDSLDNLKIAFHNRVYSRCTVFAEQNKLDFEVEKGIDAADCISQFLDRISTRLDHSVYVMIDEYDHFANELLSFHFNEFNNAVSKNGYVRKFYEALKTATFDSTISRIFITGVSPITLDSMTSGYNISTNLSLNPIFNEMFGFTSEEMKYLISITNHVEHDEETLLEMKQIYDGYIFSKKGKHHVFNPNMALYYLDYIQTNGEKPDDIVDPNIYSDYKKIENLLKIKPNKEQTEALMRIISEETITCKLTTSYDLSEDFTRDDFVSLLFYLGYLTISKVNRDQTILKAPNDVMRKVYFDYFNKMIDKDYSIHSEVYSMIVSEILDHKKNTLFVKKIEELLHSMDNRDYIMFDEKYIKVAAMSIISTSNYIHMKSEYPVPGGYIDLVLFPYQTEGATALIELKYIKKEDCNDITIKKHRDQALIQLERYKQAKEFENVGVVKWILIFSKDECVWNETIE